MRDRDPPEEKEGVLKKHALSLAEGARPARPQPLGRAERTGEYVSTAKRRPACALARRSATARRREAAPAKAGNAAGLPAEPTPPK